MLNNYKKLLKTIGVSPSQETTLIDINGVSARLPSTQRDVQNYSQFYSPYAIKTDLYNLNNNVCSIVLGTNSAAYSDTDYKLTPVASTYPNISTYFTGQNVTTTRTHGSDGSVTTLFKLAFIGKASYTISEVGMVCRGFTAASDSSTIILLDRAVFPTIQVEKGKSIVIDYSITVHVSMNIPTE